MKRGNFMAKNGFEHPVWRFLIKAAYLKIEKYRLYQYVNYILQLKIWRFDGIDNHNSRNGG